MADIKTVRFSQVVEQCGNPEPYTLWQDPEKDHVFQTALRGYRVMTVHENTVGSSADFGEVGFAEGASGEILVFEKSLQAFGGKRIVGIKYDLLKQPEERKLRPAKEERPAKPKIKQDLKRSKVIQYPKANKEPSKKEGDGSSSPTLEEMTGAVKKALAALAEDRPVAAYKILERLV